MPAMRPHIAPQFTIGEAAEVSGLSAKMIRHYESLSLIAKANRSMGNYRVYSENDVHTLRFIKRARSLGFSLTEIETLLALWRSKRRSSQQIKAMAGKHIAELDKKIAEMQSMRNALAQLAQHCHGDDRPECPILDDLSGDLTANESQCC